MRIVCLAPTYCRPRLLENVIACFERQDYPDRRLVILDDAGQIQPQAGDRWTLFSTATRYPSLPAKYQAIARLAGPCDAYAIWEDDDIYLPWHLSAAAAALGAGPWCHPSQTWTLMGREPQLEPATGRLFASTAFRRDFFDRIGGFVQTRAQNFDLQMLARLRDHGPCIDPAAERPSGYVFRWASTGQWHGQNYMPGDDQWWARCRKPPQPPVAQLHPALDPETARIYAWATR